MTAFLARLLILLVALTGIEPNGCQFSPVQFGLSVCKHVQLVSPGCSGRANEDTTLSLGCHSDFSRSLLIQPIPVGMIQPQPAPSPIEGFEPRCDRLDPIAVRVIEREGGAAT